jgi:hypothetical protein
MPGEVFFRILDGRGAVPANFLSDEQDGRVHNLPRTQNMAIHRGLSVRKTLAQAASLARVLGKDAVAEVEVTWREGDAVARTLSTRGHHTLWAHPDLIAQRVRRVHAV